MGKSQMELAIGKLETVGGQDGARMDLFVSHVRLMVHSDNQACVVLLISPPLLLVEPYYNKNNLFQPYYNNQHLITFPYYKSNHLVILLMLLLPSLLYF